MHAMGDTADLEGGERQEGQLFLEIPASTRVPNGTRVLNLCLR